MRQDEFERLHKILSEMEADVQSKADEKMLDAIRAGVGILERFVVAVEKIAANQVSTPSVVPWPGIAATNG